MRFERIHKVFANFLKPRDLMQLIMFIGPDETSILNSNILEYFGLKVSVAESENVSRFVVRLE